MLQTKKIHSIVNIYHTEVTFLPSSFLLVSAMSSHDQFKKEQIEKND